MIFLLKRSNIPDVVVFLKPDSASISPEKYALKEKNLKFEYAEKCRKLSSKELIQNFVIFYDIKSNKDSK